MDLKHLFIYKIIRSFRFIASITPLPENSEVMYYTHQAKSPQCNKRLHGKKSYIKLKSAKIFTAFIFIDLNTY